MGGSGAQRGAFGLVRHRCGHPDIAHVIVRTRLRGLLKRWRCTGGVAAGLGLVYAKTDGKLYLKNDAGTEVDLNYCDCARWRLGRP